MLAPLGLTLSDAIVLLFKKTAELGRIPFPSTQEELDAVEKSESMCLVAEYTGKDV